MSIVERAVKKLQDSIADGKSRTEVDTLPAKSAPAPVLAPAPAPSGPERRSVAEIVTEPPVSRRLDIPLDVLVANRMLVPDDQRRRLQGEFRQTKRQVIAMLSAQGSRPELLVTSSVPEEGKTFVAFNLARSIGQEKDVGVLLIDGDLARPRLTKVLGMDGQLGLTNLLADTKLTLHDVAVETSVDGLWFLPAGSPSERAPELVASARMRLLLEELASLVPRRIVLIDSPPLLASNEAQALAQSISNVLLVVRAERTMTADVKEALAMLGEGRNVSCIINQLSGGVVSNYYGSYYDESRE